VFLLGACGDITQINNQSSTIERGHAHADMMGAMLASAIVQSLKNVTWNSVAACTVANQSLPIPIRAADACKPPTLGLGSGPQWELIYARERELLAQSRAASPTTDGHFTALRIADDFALVTNAPE